jgi:PEP-CTERM motif-containing protein
MKLNFSSLLRKFGAAACMLLAAKTNAAPFFTPNNLVVVRLEGTNTVSTAEAVSLNEYNVGGANAALVQSLPVPSTGSAALTMPGVNNHDGLLNRSVDGRYLTLTGYRADAGSTDPSVKSAASTPRVIGRVGAGGSVDTSTALADSYDLTTVRGAASIDGSSFWVAGDNAGGGTPTGGLRYVASLGASTSTDLSQVQVLGGPKTPDNVRSVGIFGGQLYDSSGSSSSIGKAVLQVGSGLPTSGSQTLTTLTTDGQSTNAFFFADLSPAVPGLDTLYTSTSVLRKYSLVGGAWVANGGAIGSGFEALTAAVNGTNVTVYATNGLTVQRLVDTNGYNANLGGSLATILTAGANESFRGLSFAPVPEPTSVVLAALGCLGYVAAARRRTR